MINLTSFSQMYTIFCGFEYILKKYSICLHHIPSNSSTMLIVYLLNIMSKHRLIGFFNTFTEATETVLPKVNYVMINIMSDI